MTVSTGSWEESLGRELWAWKTTLSLFSILKSSGNTALQIRVPEHAAVFDVHVAGFRSMKVVRLGCIRSVSSYILVLDLAGNVALGGAPTALGKPWLFIWIFLTFSQGFSSHAVAAFKLNQRLLGWGYGSLYFFSLPWNVSLFSWESVLFNCGGRRGHNNAWTRSTVQNSGFWQKIGSEFWYAGSTVSLSLSLSLSLSF